MRTRHRLLQHDARDPAPTPEGSVALVVTSPPYPMIEMWDEAFSAMSPEAARALAEGRGAAAFEAMHAQLDRVWVRVAEALMPGGVACVNIGDATRSLDGQFALYPNHARAQLGAMAAGLTPLTGALWRKPTNAPNKFMGSGMMPPGAYITLEHEHLLVFRKGGKRAFTDEAARALRRRSAFFWEERNAWFSDLWEGLPGTPQALTGAGRARSGAFPLELPWRLIQMFSLQEDLVWDPFAGTGTTLVAAAMAARHSLGCELDGALVEAASLDAVPTLGLERTRERLGAHRRFVAERQARGLPLTHTCAPYRFPVMTRHETELLFPWPVGVRRAREGWVVEHLLTPDDPGGVVEGPQLSLLGA